MIDARRMRCAFLVLLVPPLASCGQSDAESCSVPVGTYSATYELRSGSCDTAALSVVSRVPVDGARLLLASTEMLPSVDVVTVAWIAGCSVELRQDVLDRSGVLQMTVNADVIAAGDGTMAGTAEVARYSEQQEPTCTGTYDIELTPEAKPSGF